LADEQRDFGCPVLLGKQQQLQLCAAEDNGIAIPVAVTVFPGEIYRAPKSWTQRAFRNLTYFNQVDKGGHFAAWEEPQLFAAEVRSAFRGMR
jgi:pimeloyl-ACP methyl ester carboxylesterase